MDLGAATRPPSFNPKQLKWAHKYLQRKGEIDLIDHSSTIDKLHQIGEELERSRTGALILGQMRGAWRQAKCKDSDKDKDRKTYAFKLEIDVKEELTRLAKKKKITAADMLSRLISAELDAHARFEEKLNEAKKTHKELLSDSRNNTAHYRQRLAQLLPRAELHVFPGADHSLGFTHAAEVTMLIERHLACW